MSDLSSPHPQTDAQREEPSRWRNDDALQRIAIRERGDGSYEGWGVRGFRTRTFGGSVLGQCLRAASTVASPERHVNALHAYFLAPGMPQRPFVYSAEPLKLGRSLDVVNVVAEQNDRTVMAMQASFHSHEPSPEFQISAPVVPGPEELPAEVGGPPGTNPDVRGPFERRHVDEADLPGGVDPNHRRRAVWLRTRHAIPDDRQPTHAALLAYAIDFLITRVAHDPLEGAGLSPVGASLDHTMWFHRNFRADEWLLLSTEAVSYAGSRAMSRCLIYTEAGELVASASQEALLRAASE